jgi:hypothetical protein
VIGNNTVGLTAADVTAAFQINADPPGVAGQFTCWARPCASRKGRSPRAVPSSSATSRAACHSRAGFFKLIGKGYSQLDGFGFANAEKAVDAVWKNKHK